MTGHPHPLILRAALLLLLSTTAVSARAQEESNYAEMALEDLLSVQVGQRALMDVHHTHPKGEWMISYRYMYMRMDGNRTDTTPQSTDGVLGDYMVAPVGMSMHMHMLGVMYAPTQRVTLMAMVPFHVKAMKHVMRSGMTFGASSQGVGDVSLTVLYSVLENHTHRLVANVGASLPVGSIDARDDLPAGDDAPLPYPMQLGSGSVDPIVGLTYIGTSGDWSWGTHAKGIVRFAQNDHDYRMGDEQRLTVWASRTWHPWFSSTLRLDAENQQDYEGARPDLNRMMVPTADPELRSGRRLTAALGFNVHAPRGAIEGHQLSVEAGAPIYQHLDGPQLERDYQVRAGWSVTF